MREKTSSTLMRPFGYDKINGELVVNNDEASVVRTIYNLYARGEVPGDIAKYLNLTNLNSDGRLWKKHHIVSIVHNPIYAGFVGLMKSNRRLGTHKPIVNLDVFSRINGPIHQIVIGKRSPVSDN